MGRDKERLLKKRIYLLDPSVVEAYRKTRSMKMLVLFGKSVGECCIGSLTPGVDAKQLMVHECEAARFRIIEPEIEQLIEAERWPPPRLCGRYDRLNVIIARDLNSFLITNDKHQRAMALDAGVRCMWGLEVMAKLVDLRKLKATDANKVAEEIRKNDPRWATAEVYAAFRHRVGLDLGDTGNRGSRGKKSPRKREPFEIRTRKD
jgi:hypothetical protein